MTMNKSYQIKAVDAKGQHILETVLSASGKGPLVLQAQAGVRYVLIDVQQASAPDNVRVQRSGKHLQVFFEGSVQPDLVLENHFDSSAVNPPSLVGMTDSGALHEYIPESGQPQDTLARLADNSAPQGMALGGPELPPLSGAAVGLLAPVAGGGLGLGAAGAGVLGAAALGGGGGGARPSKPVVTALAMDASCDTGPSGDHITQNRKPLIVGKATPQSVVTVVLNGNIRYTASADDNGDFRIDLSGQSSELNPGCYTLQATALKSGVSSDTFSGTPFTIDTSAGDNYDASNRSVSDANTGASLTGLSLSDDTGQPGDLMTSVQHLKFIGTLANYSDNGDKVRVTLSKLGDASFQPLSAYLTPNAQNQWIWDQSALTLASGKYTLQSVLVDGAGNEVHSASNPPISWNDTITVSPGNGKIVNPDGTVSDDANTSSKAAVVIGSLTNDTGVSNSDFVTNDNTLVFKGTLERFTSNGDMLQLVLKNSTGALVRTAFISPTGNAWFWDLSTLQLADGQYELSASIVDAGGNTVKDTTVANQKLAVDTSASKNHGLTSTGDDANAALTLVLTGMSDSADGFRLSTGSDRITNTPRPSFSGHFGSGKTWSANGDSFQFQVYKPDGTLVMGQSSIASDGKSWSSGDWGSTALNDGTYIARTSITDAAGNVISMQQQTFAVDQTAPSLQSTQSLRDITLTGDSYSGGQTVSNLALSSNEAVHYVIQSGNTVLAEGDYTGQAATTANTIPSRVFAPGAFTVTYTDTAGNTSSYTNSIELNFTADTAVKTAAPSQTFTPLPNPNQALGSIGKITLGTTNPLLDLCTVIGSGKELHNHIDMSAAGSQQVSLNLNDVLSLGVSNSFRLDGLPQLRIDGGIDDSVVFKDRSAWSVAASGVDIGASHYNLYTSHDSHGALLEVLIAHGVQVS
jgi:hypothetical protein